MDIKWIVFGVILVVNAIFAISITIFVAKKFVVAGRNALIFALISLAIWSFGYAMITFSTNMETKQFWLRVENIGITSQPVLWFYFILTYVRQTRFLKWPHITLLCIIPVISLTLIFSDQWFHIYYTSIKLSAENGGPLIIGRGPWYWMEFAQS